MNDTTKRKINKELAEIYDYLANCEDGNSMSKSMAQDRAYFLEKMLREFK